MEREIRRFLIDTIPESVVAGAERLTIDAGSYIICANEPINFFYILVQGSAKLIHEDLEADPLIIDIYHSGDFMGEMEMLGLKTKDRSIISMTKCELLKLTRGQFFRLWSENIDFSMHLLYIHCLRLLQAGDDKIYADRAILRDRLFRLVQLNLNERGYFRYTKQILSEMAGVSMRSLNRSLRELEQNRLIRVSSGTIRLCTESFYKS
jgi:CRP/FNR family transcriptional regulator